MTDSYEHLDKNVIYIEESIPGPARHSDEHEQLINNFNSQLTDHCKCNTSCQETCNCVQRSCGLNYIKVEYEFSKYILNFEKDLKLVPIIECNSLCKCSDECSNRLVQKGPKEGLVVNICKDSFKGLGLFTKESICKGTFVCEYAGEVITKSEALKRHEYNQLKGKINYIYCLNEYGNGTMMQTFVDPSDFGNIGRYINHSCEPNCIIIPVRVDSPIPKLAIFSCKDIAAGTEITFDYGNYNLKDTSSSNSNMADGKRVKCMCNSNTCKGWIPYDEY